MRSRLPSLVCISACPAACLYICLSVQIPGIATWSSRFPFMVVQGRGQTRNLGSHVFTQTCNKLVFVFIFFFLEIQVLVQKQLKADKDRLYSAISVSLFSSPVCVCCIHCDLWDLKRESRGSVPLTKSSHCGACAWRRSSSCMGTNQSSSVFKKGGWVVYVFKKHSQSPKSESEILGTSQNARIKCYFSPLFTTGYIKNGLRCL